MTTPKKLKVPRISPEKITAARQMLANTTKSVAQVAKELKMSKGSVYYHTGGKRRTLEVMAHEAKRKVAAHKAIGGLASAAAKRKKAAHQAAA